MRVLLLSILLLIASSCLKEELPIPAKDKGEGNVVAISIGSDYTEQVFFNLEEQKIVSQNNKYIWDIAFESGEEGWHVLTNTSKHMFVHRTDQTDMTIFTSKYGYTNNPIFDAANGDLDSTGVGDWTDGKIRLLDMGTTHTGEDLGWYKLKVTAVTATYYYFEYAPLQSTNVTQDSIAKNEDYNYVYFSLLDSKVKIIEPPKDSWDIVFTQYIEHLVEPLIMDYLLTGCLLNPYQTKAALITEKKYEEIDLSYVALSNLSSAKNAIGYTWKNIGIEQVMEGGSATYTIFPEKSYAVLDQKGNYYKLKFLDFYSKTGEKGTPTFKYILLD